MVENINLQKISFPIPSATKVKALEKKKGQMNDRRFKRKLEEEEGEDRKNKNEGWQSHDNAESDINQQTGNKLGSENQQRLVLKKLKNDDLESKLIDIVV